MSDLVMDTTPAPRKLTMMQSLAIYDDQGRCRCPMCGKFAKPSDFVGSQQSLTIPGGRATLLPGCRKCRG